MTSRYGDVYFRARISNSCRSSLDKLMMYGLGLGTSVALPLRGADYLACQPSYNTSS